MVLSLDRKRGHDIFLMRCKVDQREEKEDRCWNKLFPIACHLVGNN